MPPRVTVVIPYAGGPFLLEAVVSVLEQTSQNFEIIVVDDCSQERAASVLEGLKDFRLHVFRLEEKGGISKALNLGVLSASGDLIARMDADDISLPRRLELQVQFMIEHPDVVVCGSAVQTTGLHSRLIKMPSSDICCRVMLLDSPCFAHPSVMFRRTPAIDAGLYDSAFDGAEDYEFWCRLSRSGKLANLPLPLLSYRQHQNQTTRTNSERSAALRERISARYVRRKTEQFWPIFRFLARVVLHTLGRTYSLVHKVRSRTISSPLLWRRQSYMARQPGRFDS